MSAWVVDEISIELPKTEGSKNFDLEIGQINSKGVKLFKQKSYGQAIDKFNTEEERPLVGIIKYSDGTFNKNELVGVRPYSKYEFVVDGERLYRVMNHFITIKYEYQGNEEEYNPSWSQSS